ncbi:GntR family transcriptional regulator [Actinopolymorpha pittospori]|uniref:DNA-binding GntR family transcriptional regulator n=1 Tax=Actinopolymorpha pittospori TaxID=648752 RepID=A0A927MVX9_9ACTN|nr:GntR family transcriptional regulator [Actinopolymorpha pittospori]MBE1607267.1 DNA-binding GntR family transcriptional regulator [Actinopolymorpha pittospori]
MTTRSTYLELADRLADQLRDTPPGTRVASEYELVASHGVSRLTARAALQELEHRYLVQRVRGSGTFVRRRIDYTISKHIVPSFTATVAAAGARPGTRLLSVRRRDPEPVHSYEPEIADGGSIVEVRRLNLVDGEVAGVLTSVLPGDRLPGLEEHLGDDFSLHTLVSQVYGVQLQRYRHQVLLDVPDRDVADLLGDEAPRPCWYAESLNRVKGTTQLGEYSYTWSNPHVIRMVFQIEEEG